MFLHPHYETAGILFRPMVPFGPTLLRDFGGLAVFISAGTDLPEQLAAIFESGGADVSLFWHDGGHELGADDVIAAKSWLSDKAAKRLAA
jgi:phospholipase/carboxylesterase